MSTCDVRIDVDRDVVKDVRESMKKKATYPNRAHQEQGPRSKKKKKKRKKLKRKKRKKKNERMERVYQHSSRSIHWH